MSYRDDNSFRFLFLFPNTRKITETQRDLHCTMEDLYTFEFFYTQRNEAKVINF